MPEHNQKSIGREVIEERIGLTGCWKGPSDNIPWFITVSVGSNCAGHGPATLWNCYWGREAQRTAGRKGFCASQGRGSRGTENALCCPLAQSQLLFQAATTSHSCTSTLGVLLVLLNSDTDFIELIASTRNTQQGLENMAKVLFFTLESASAAHTRFGAGLCHQTRAQGCSSALLKSSHFWYHSILRALHRCKFISGSTLQTLQIPERLTEVLNEHRPQSPLIFFPYWEKPTIPFSCDSSILPVCRAMLGWTVSTNYTSGLSLLALLLFTVAARWQSPAQRNSRPCSRCRTWK